MTKAEDQTQHATGCVIALMERNAEHEGRAVGQAAPFRWHSKMRHNPIRFLVVVAALAAGAGLIACGPQEQGPSGPLEKVTIALVAPPYTALVDIALAKGYFRQEGLEAVGRSSSSGKAALEEVQAGIADIATSSETPFMFAVLGGQKIAAIATVQHSRRSNAIVARKDRGIRAPKDLGGKRIGFARGTNLEYFLDIFLTTHGVARRDVTAVDLRTDEMPAALANGQVDAVSTFPPFLNEAQAKLGDRGVTLYAEEIYTQTLALSAGQEWIRANSARVEKILRALLQAEEFLLREPAAAQKVVADFRRTDPAVVGAIWPDQTFEVSLDQSLLLALEDEARWAVRQKLTSATTVPNFLNYVALDGLKAVKPKAVRILR
jgi:ABC-type nitrate/sulfonate/bicarbonate transport system substrate-binding protein